MIIFSFYSQFGLLISLYYWLKTCMMSQQKQVEIEHVCNWILAKCRWEVSPKSVNRSLYTNRVTFDLLKQNIECSILFILVHTAFGKPLILVHKVVKSVALSSFQELANLRYERNVLYFQLVNHLHTFGFYPYQRDILNILYRIVVDSLLMACSFEMKSRRWMISVCWLWIMSSNAKEMRVVIIM